MAHLDFEAPLVELEERIAALKALTDGATPEAEAIDIEIETLQAQVEDLQRKLYADLDVWKKVQLSRHPDRPYLGDYIPLLFEGFVELHGDRVFSDDPAIISGFARFEGWLAESDLSSITSDCCFLNRRGIFWHDDVSRNSAHSRRQRQRLGMVAG